MRARGGLSMKRLLGAVRYTALGSLTARFGWNAKDVEVGRRSIVRTIDGQLKFIGYGGTVTMTRRKGFWHKVRRLLRVW